MRQVAPKEVLVPRGRLSAATQRALAAPAVPLEVAPVAPGAEFPEPEDVQRPSPEQHQVSPGPGSCLRVHARPVPLRSICSFFVHAQTTQVAHMRCLFDGRHPLMQCKLFMQQLPRTDSRRLPAQKLFRGLAIPEGIKALGGGPLAALSALCLNLRRLKADQELATSAQQAPPLTPLDSYLLPAPHRSTCNPWPRGGPMDAWPPGCLALRSPVENECYDAGVLG